MDTAPFSSFPFLGKIFPSLPFCIPGLRFPKPTKGTVSQSSTCHQSVTVLVRESDLSSLLMYQ